MRKEPTDAIANRFNFWIRMKSLKKKNEEDETTQSTMVMFSLWKGNGKCIRRHNTHTHTPAHTSSHVLDGGGYATRTEPTADETCAHPPDAMWENKNVNSMRSIYVFNLGWLKGKRWLFSMFATRTGRWMPIPSKLNSLKPLINHSRSVFVAVVAVGVGRIWLTITGDIIS